MNRIIISIMMCVVALTNPILAADQLSISQFLIVSGMTEEEFTINLDNDQTYAAFQFDLYLPEGVTITKSIADNRIPAKTEIQMSQQADGSYRFIAVANDLKKNISGTSGSIIIITVAVNNDFESESPTGYFRNIKLSDNYGEGKTYDEMSFPITVVKCGDVNGDGEINTVDASYILMRLVGNAPSDFVEAAADVDGDGEISTVDATRILQMLVE